MIRRAFNRLPWSWRTSFIPHTTWLELSKIFYARVKCSKAMTQSDTQRVRFGGFLGFCSEKCSLREKLHAPAFVASFLICASYDYDLTCVRLPWSWRTSFIPHMTWSDLSKLFYARVKCSKAMTQSDTQRVRSGGSSWFCSEKCSLREKLHAPASVAFFLFYAFYDHDSTYVRLP